MDLRIKIASPDKRHKIPCDTFYKVGYSKPCISAWGVGSGSELVIVVMVVVVVVVLEFFWE